MVISNPLFSSSPMFSVVDVYPDVVASEWLIKRLELVMK